MPTPVMMPVIVALMQFYPGAGTAVPAPRVGQSNIMATYFSVADCDRDRYLRGNPADYYCLEYKSEKIIDYTFPQDKSHQGALPQEQPKEPQAATAAAPVQLAGGHSVGPTKLRDADKPYLEVAAKLPSRRLTLLRRTRKQRRKSTPPAPLASPWKPRRRKQQLLHRRRRKWLSGRAMTNRQCSRATRLAQSSASSAGIGIPCGGGPLHTTSPELAKCGPC